jgi:hypothetical protein
LICKYNEERRNCKKTKKKQPILKTFSNKINNNKKTTKFEMKKFDRG